jgi:hypothetical protein
MDCHSSFTSPFNRSIFMKHTPISLVCGTAIFAASAAAVASDLSPDRERQLLERIDQLESRLAQVEDRHGDNWLTQRRADEIRGIVHDVLADADMRATLLGSGMSAGWDDGFFLASADGNYRLNISGQMQFRFVYNYQDNPQDIVDEEGEFLSTGDRHRSGFENSRTQLIFTGHIVNPQWIYRVQGNYLRSSGRFELEEAYMGYSFGNGWTFLAGQFRVPMLREFLVTEMRQQAIERSLVHQEFTAARTQGVAVNYRDDMFNFTGGFTDGHPATGAFNSPWSRRDTEFAFTGRLEAKLAGEWDQFNDFASWRNEDFGLLVGGAIHWQKDEYGMLETDKLEVLQWTLDAQVEFGGANVFAYIVGRHLSSDALNADQYGFVVQGGYFLTDDWEIFARYEWGDDDVGGKNLSLMTFGANYYVAAHRVKWSADVGIALQEVSNTWGNGFIGSGGDLAGWRADQQGQDGQVVIRTQLQLVF